MVDGEGEHADQAVQGRHAPFPKGVQHHLGIGLRAKAVAALDQLSAQVAIIVDLAVVDDPPIAVGIRHRHAAGLAQIDDAQTIGAEAGLTQASHAFLVGAAMALQFAHLRDHRGMVVRMMIRPRADQPGNPTHQTVSGEGFRRTRCRKTGVARVTWRSLQARSW